MAFALSVLPMVHAAGASHADSTRQPAKHTCMFDQQMLRTESGACRPHAARYPRNVKGTVKRAVYDGALVFGIPYSVLFKIARCESSLNPRATNGTHFGLFQFLPETFYRGSKQLRRATGITTRSYWNPRDASYVAGYLFATGQAPSWACE